MNDIIFNSLEQHADFMKLKNSAIHSDLIPDLLINMNPILADVLISNRISNAIRYNFDSGIINIFLMIVE